MTVHLEAEELPKQLKDFADDVTTFLDCLNKFPELSDDGLNSSIIFLKGDLQVCLLSGVLFIQYSKVTL